ncbi:protein YpfM [Salmonella enterica subsp. enterica]|nr:protein YpfM [Salmonella enterica subsp. enterica]
MGNWGTGELGNWKDFIEVMLRINAWKAPRSHRG